jgi:hypothetical protein
MTRNRHQAYFFNKLLTLEEVPMAAPIGAVVIARIFRVRIRPEQRADFGKA